MSGRHAPAPKTHASRWLPAIVTTHIHTRSDTTNIDLLYEPPFQGTCGSRSPTEDDDPVVIRAVFL